MLKVMTVATVAFLGLIVTVTPKPAFARDGGAIAAGIIGGLAVGAIIGSQANRGDYGGSGYYEPRYQPVYGNCHIEREQFEDRYGNLRTRRIHVCE